MCGGREPSRRGCEAAFRLAWTSCGVPKQRPAGLYGGPDTGRGTGALEEGGRTTRNGSRRGRGGSWPSTAGARTVETGGCGAGGEDAHLPGHGPGRAGAGRGTAGPACPRRTGNGPCWRPCPQETEAVGRGVAHSGAGAVPAGIRSPVYPHGFDGPGAGGRGTRRARQYSETAEQAGRACSSSPPTQWRLAPLQLALAEQDGPEALAVLERLLRSLEEPWDLKCPFSHRHLPNKGGCEGSPADHAPISAGGTEAGPGIRFSSRGDPWIPGDAGAGSLGRNIDKINYFIRKIDLKNGLGGVRWGQDETGSRQRAGRDRIAPPASRAAEAGGAVSVCDRTEYRASPVVPGPPGWRAVWGQTGESSKGTRPCGETGAWDDLFFRQGLGFL